MDGPRYRRDRALLVGAALVALVALACPKPGPTPVLKPDASDAAPASPPAPSCSSACGHADAVCPGSLSPCTNACNRIGADYASCAAGLKAGAGVCEALNDCDPLNVLNHSGAAARPHGR